MNPVDRADSLTSATAHLPGLLGSAEPAVVFAGLARFCVPTWCDACTFDIAEGDHARYRILDPGSHSRADDAEPTLHHHRVPFADSPVAGAGAHDVPFSGTAIFEWHHRLPDQFALDVTVLLVAHAVQAVAAQRAELRASAATAASDNLRIALDSSRQIGMAIGILMRQHMLTDQAAFDVLKQASQFSQRKVRDLAVDVIETGWLDPAFLAPREVVPQTLPVAGSATPGAP